MIDRGLLRTAAESATEAAGSSLARSLCHIPVTIGLSGALGAGKTAFMRGFLRALGVSTTVTSPTYALEQRYDTPRGEVLHVDLYRLDEADARNLLQQSEQHAGIRCVEWPEKAGTMFLPQIRVTITEAVDTARTIDIACDDASWPSDAEIDGWRTELLLPENIAAHCDAVGDFCAHAADMLMERGTFARKQFVRAAGKAHDLLRFVDFRENAAPAGWKSSADEEAVWTQWKERFPGMTHEEAAHAFLAERGYPELARLVAAHSIHLAPSERRTTEEHLLYYADKRFIGDRQVSLAERYGDFAVRYGNGTPSTENLRWEQEARDTEALLFPDGAPF